MKAVVAILLSLVLAAASAMRGGDVGMEARALDVACAGACDDVASEPMSRGGDDADEDCTSATMADCDCVSCPCCAMPTPRTPVPGPPSTPVAKSDWRSGLQWTPGPVAFVPPASVRSWAMEFFASAGVRALGRSMSAPEQCCVWRT